MNILITGSSGLIGTAFKELLKSKGHDVFGMPRSKQIDTPFYWQPSENFIQYDQSIPIDAVVNLAGENIAEGRWNGNRKNIILNSRVQGTQLLSTTLAKLEHKPKVLISASAIGYYGNTCDQTVDEASDSGSDFLSEVSQQWEQATRPAIEAGIRTVHIRTGAVLSPAGGMLNKMLVPFKLGLGGIIGSGRQYISWVSINDVSNMILFLIEGESITGPVNLVSKQASTNYTFTKTLGKVLKRPTIFPLPAMIARIVFGEMADALLLSSTRVKPKKLEEAGYNFIDQDLELTLRSLLKK